ncbi:MAG TPA: M48 family metallopeptidase [Pyrinomonadaceae bacterium]|nr:M48 family metallopeptidase [Chloracidobacterium sp.]MBP9936337.1 M48 family metallopeptidase [Pyrinomonadaceae bacterium]MBK9438375.1 M48 family metallopeptidase [Chloracidobacterium sp.]MBL0240741.1 M48 family metallopeptidase [Chloracidobacterium sp.]HQX56365.1 M48 family metallopeptidase [Pyrinomonadaceae bacterium]
MAKKKPDGEETSTTLTKSLSVRCRYCGQKNAVKEGYVNGDAVCGKCKLPLSNAPHKKFAALNKHEYIHPADSKALAALRAIPGIDTALKKLLAVTGESAIRVSFMASAIKVTPKQCPDLYAKLQIACTTLGVDMPDMFIQQNPMVNAFTGGVERPVIVLHSALIERLTDEETLAVIAHEVGHIHAEHVLYLTAARLMEALANLSVARLIPGSDIIKFIVSAGISSALLAWSRRAELSCDRAALLVTQDPHVIGRTMMKLGGGTLASKVDYDQFLEQAREFQTNYDENKLDKFWADIINAGLSHPFPVWRVSEILQWVETGDYERVMNEH